MVSRPRGMLFGRSTLRHNNRACKMQSTMLRPTCKGEFCCEIGFECPPPDQKARLQTNIPSFLTNIPSLRPLLSSYPGEQDPTIYMSTPEPPFTTSDMKTSQSILALSLRQRP